jgi:UDP-glucose 4-epimerase
MDGANGRRRRVCVTGAAGFIGSHVVRALAERLPGVELVGLDDLSTGRRTNLDGVACRLVEGSIVDATALAAATAGADAIVHLAARTSVPRSLVDPEATHEVNARGTQLVLEAARTRGAHVVVASSSSVYGANPHVPQHEDLEPQPVSPYAVSKWLAEQHAFAAQRDAGVPVLVLRLFNVIGPRQRPDHAYAAVVPTFVHAALRGEPVCVHGDGSQSRDFTYVGMVADVIATAVQRRLTSSTPVNVALGVPVSLLEMLASIETLVGTTVERRHVDARLGDVRCSHADPTRLRTLMGDVAPVSLDEGLARTIDWMRTEMDVVATVDARA